jgi:hypothetical protein
MGIVKAGNPPQPRDEITGKDRIEVDGANSIHFLAYQVKKEPEMVFQVEKLTAPGQHSQPVLPVWLLDQRQGTPVLPPDQGHRKTCAGQGSTDPDHPLVIVQIIGHRTKDPLFHPANMLKLPDITHLQAKNQHFYRIFAPGNNNFGKIVLILPTAIPPAPPG